MTETIERKIEIRGADGTAEGFLYAPEGKGPWPGVVFLTDIFGIRPPAQGMARRVAAEGYAVLMPNIFYRTDRLPIMDFEFRMGEERSMQRIQHLLGALDADRMARDGVAYADDLLTRPEAKPGKVAMVGYCFTGQMALRTAAAAPGKIAAAASFHGGRLVTDAPDSPHKLLPKVTAALYFGHAVEDQSMSAENIAVFEAALKDWGGNYESETYEGARHGWTVPGGPVYHEKQAARAHEKLIALLDTTLK